MQITIEGKEIKLSHMGIVRWIGKWFSQYETPKDSILLDDEKWETLKIVRKKANYKPEKKSRYKKND